MTNNPSPSAITVSLEWAKKLKEAGWDEKTVFAFDHRFDYYELDDFYGLGALMAPSAEELIAEILKRTDWTMALLLGNVASLMHYQNYKGTLADCLAEVFCNSIRIGTIPTMSE